MELSTAGQKEHTLVIFHPATRTDSKLLATKIAYIPSYLCELQIDMIEDGNIHTNHPNSRSLHLNGKGVLQFAKYFIEGIRKLWSKKEHRNHVITIPEHRQATFRTIILIRSK